MKSEAKISSKSQKVTDLEESYRSKSLLDFWQVYKGFCIIEISQELKKFENPKFRRF